MLQHVKTLEIRYVESYFDATAWNYETNTQGAWLHRYAKVTTYKDAILIMKEAKRAVGAGMPLSLVAKIASVHSVFSGDNAPDTHQINPNSKFWREQRRLRNRNAIPQPECDEILEF